MVELLKPLRTVASFASSRLAERATNKALEARVAEKLNLLEIRLPASHGSINIGAPKNGAALNINPDEIKAQGYDGVRILPEAGLDRSELRCTAWNGITLEVARRENFVVVLQDLTVWGGVSRAVSFGHQNLSKIVSPGFELRAYRCAFRAAAPTDAGRPKWLVFGYQFDGLFVDCVFDGYHLGEHDFYGHGSAGKGWAFIGCRFLSSGAEQIKVRSDATETGYAGPQVRLIVRECTFEEWYQDHSDRGGAGIVVQGGALHGLVERCVFRGGEATARVPANARAHCIMVSSEGLSYDIDTGAVDGTGYGNGHWVIRDCALWAHSDVPWRNDIIRFGRNGGTQKVAKSVRILRSGIWGRMVQLGVTEVGTLRVEGCNTPALADFCRNTLGMFTSSEAFFPTSTRRVPLSEGISR
jgi:hypothetical protein